MLFEIQQVDLSPPGTSMGADFFSPAIDITGFDCGGMQMVWTGADSTKAKLVPQMSIDGVNYCDYVSISEAQKVDQPSGCKMYEVPKFCFRWMRLSFIHNSNTAGTIQIIAFLKRLRVSP